MRKKREKGQVTVELLLVLPVFFLLLFTIMEFGLLAHHVIVVNHAAYEIARIGSLLAGPAGGQKPQPAKIDMNKLESVKCQIFSSNCGMVKLTATTEITSYDPQAGPTHTNEDIIVTITYPAVLIFPIVNYFLSHNKCVGGRCIRWITVSVRMPVEKPLFQSQSF